MSVSDLRPLGSLAPKPGGIPWCGEQLDRSSEMPHALRNRVTAYLSQCPIFLAWMGYTRDEIGDRFGVSGGSAIASDGAYYWRVDAVEYIKEYGIPVPDEAIHHFKSKNWRPPDFDRKDYLAIYDRLTELLVDDESR